MTYDPAFMNTASCRSSITYIDGDLGDPALSRISYRSSGRALHLPRKSRISCYSANCRQEAPTEALGA
jgi:hypothetical protein